MKALRFNLDSLGMCASALCMVHCLVFPVALLALPVLNLSASQPVTNLQPKPTGSAAASTAAGADCCEKESCCAHGEGCAADEEHTAACCSTPFDFWLHVGLLAGVAPLGVVAWGFGVRKHGRWGVLMLGTTGVLLLSGALLFGTQLFGFYGEPAMTVLGSICMVSAHFWNRRQCKCCETSHPGAMVEIEEAPSNSQPVSLQS